MSYKEFHNDLKKEYTRNALFLYGEENYLMRWAVDLLIEENTDEDSRDFSVMELSGAACTPDEIIESAYTYSMLGGKRIVLVRDYLSLYKKTDVPSLSKEDNERILELFNNPFDSSLVIFTLDSRYKANMTAFAKKLAAVKGSGYEFSRLGKPELRSFVRKRANEASKYIRDRVVDHIIELTGYLNKESRYNLDMLANDIKKLANAVDGDEITAVLADEILIGEGERYVFSLIDAMMEKNKRRAMELTINILADEESVAMSIFALLTRQFEIMYDSIDPELEGLSVQEMAKVTGTNEYRFKKAYRDARRFSPERIKELLTELYNIDKSIKSGNIDPNTAIELFVLN